MEVSNEEARAALDYKVEEKKLTPENVPPGTTVLNPACTGMLKVTEWDGEIPRLECWKGTDLGNLGNEPGRIIEGAEAAGVFGQTVMFILNDDRAHPAVPEEEEVPSALSSLASIHETLQQGQEVAPPAVRDEEKPTLPEPAIIELPEPAVTEPVAPEEIPEEDTSTPDRLEGETKKAWLYNLVADANGFLSRGEFFRIAGEEGGVYADRDLDFIDTRLRQFVAMLKGDGLDIDMDDELIWIGKRPDVDLPGSPTEEEPIPELPLVAEGLSEPAVGMTAVMSSTPAIILRALAGALQVAVDDLSAEADKLSEEE